MNRFLTTILAATLLLAAAPAAWAQNPQEPDMDKIINTQLENLTRTFKLDEVQVSKLPALSAVISPGFRPRATSVL